MKSDWLDSDRVAMEFETHDERQTFREGLIAAGVGVPDLVKIGAQTGIGETFVLSSDTVLILTAWGEKLKSQEFLNLMPLPYGS